MILRAEEPDEFAKRLEKDNKDNRQSADEVRKKGKQLGSVTIDSHGAWSQSFYFPLDNPYVYRLVNHVEANVIVDGLAFVFPFDI